MRLRYAISAAVFIFGVGWLFPERAHLPVEGAHCTDWNAKSFWYEPWGISGAHKGIDIFSKIGTPAVAPIGGVVVFAGELGLGGNVLLILGPKWRLHYLAHLSRLDRGFLSAVAAGTTVGAVGDSGNAHGKPPHLHYAILTPFPYLWRWSTATQGWKKIFFLDPGVWLAPLCKERNPIDKT